MLSSEIASFGTKLYHLLAILAQQNALFLKHFQPLMTCSGPTIYSRKLSDCSRVYLIWIFSSNRQCRLWVVISISRCNTFTNVNGISQFALLCPRAFERSPKLQKQAKYHYDQNGSDRENKGHHWRHRYTFDRPKIRCAR